MTAPLDDPYAKQKAGDRATIQAVDDAGNLLCVWDCGSSLNIIPGVDSFVKLPIVTDTVFEQIMAIRAMPDCPNMFSANEVQRLAFEHDFHELVIFIEENRGVYARFIMTGERESAPE